MPAVSEVPSPPEGVVPPGATDAEVIWSPVVAKIGFDESSPQAVSTSEEATNMTPNRARFGSSILVT